MLWIRWLLSWATSRIEYFPATQRCSLLTVSTFQTFLPPFSFLFFFFRPPSLPPHCRSVQNPRESFRWSRSWLKSHATPTWLRICQRVILWNPIARQTGHQVNPVDNDYQLRVNHPCHSYELCSHDVVMVTRHVFVALAFVTKPLAAHRVVQFEKISRRRSEAIRIVTLEKNIFYKVNCLERPITGRNISFQSHFFKKFSRLKFFSYNYVFCFFIIFLCTLDTFVSKNCVLFQRFQHVF